MSLSKWLGHICGCKENAEETSRAERYRDRTVFNVIQGIKSPAIPRRRGKTTSERVTLYALQHIDCVGEVHAGSRNATIDGV